MRFEVWPQFWPFTGLDYVGNMDLAARKSTVFGRKSTEKHSKWGKRLLLFSLGARCCRFESCHFDQTLKRGLIAPLFNVSLEIGSWWEPATELARWGFWVLSLRPKWDLVECSESVLILLLFGSGGKQEPRLNQPPPTDKLGRGGY